VGGDGEIKMRAYYGLILAVLLIGLTFWGFVGYVALHFVEKFW
jgi:hypothetical protein